MSSASPTKFVSSLRRTAIKAFVDAVPTWNKKRKRPNTSNEITPISDWSCKAYLSVTPKFATKNVKRIPTHFFHGKNI
jgi:hypothetical protein